MEHQKLLNLLNDASNFRFAKIKRNIVNDQLNANYNVGNKIICNTEVLKYNICYYNDAYILLRFDITIIENSLTQVTFKNYAPFIKCITKLDGTTVDDDKDLDLVMPMYNFSEYCSNYSDTTSSLWSYSKDGATNFDANVVDGKNFKSFSYKAKILTKTITDCDNRILRNILITLPLKYLSKFWRLLEISLVNLRVELKLKWKKDFVLAVASGDNTNVDTKYIIFTIKDTKFYVPAVTLSAKDNQKLSKLLTEEFERSLYWNIKRKVKI